MVWKLVSTGHGNSVSLLVFAMVGSYFVIKESLWELPLKALFIFHLEFFRLEEGITKN